MSVIISVFYPLWYQSSRAHLKDTIDIDINATKTELERIITEHDEIYPPEELEIKRDYNYGQKIILERARNHIQEAVIDLGNPNYYEVNGGTFEIKPHSEKVKEILGYIPKSDYTDLG